jgi:hypothetical protein
MNEEKDWYEHRHELEVGDVFETHRGHVVALENRTVIGDPCWRVVSLLNGEWFYDGDVVHPSDLKTRIERYYG